MGLADAGHADERAAAAAPGLGAAFQAPEPAQHAARATGLGPTPHLASTSYALSAAIGRAAAYVDRISMATTASLDALLKLGSVEFNKRRKAEKAPGDYTGATLVRVTCANANLSGLTLAGAEWDSCDLSNLDFRGADLSNAYFHGGRLEDCDFRGANLEGASFEKLKLKRCDFSDAKGLVDLEVTKVDMHDVIGLDPDVDDDDDDE